MTTMAATVIILPPYTPSPPVPSYSPEPAHDERRVEHTPRSRTRPPAGNYIKKSGRETLVLTEQEEAAEHPTYGRHATISGFLALEDRETVSEVVLKVSFFSLDIVTESVSSFALHRSRAKWR
jgi:hypothetical protein